ncbi:hypothetical protein [Qipengyuania atrilutea]|uniref:Uncharacterized protein n=1 Tax=Qipengyuania atrilutea TaxID=2744473 RepID=A0A850H5S3_9SPHN|nr:hypothetical protein [Actirhodobacter atriluteus]NVD44485.1 hypothetical protein [Actirhodobacter atriluteus]
MVIFVMFALGIGNFAIHKAVLQSGHPMLREIKALTGAARGHFTFVAEFAWLLAAMLLAGNGWAGVAWIYALYSGLNLATGWLILTRRI